MTTTDTHWDTRWNDTSRIPSSGNIFADLGFNRAEAEVMKLRTEVMMHTAQWLKEQDWTQAEAARQLGITQPRISRLIEGKVEDFSLDMLITLAARAGLHPELRLAAV
ncbi:MAG: XRE family transcriptional regulator [Comamonas sp.]|nr:XRE family transcriptional regulator [Comamonas sp.]